MRPGLGVKVTVILGVALLAGFLKLIAIPGSAEVRATRVEVLILVPAAIGAIIGFFRAGTGCVDWPALLGAEINFYVAMIGGFLLLDPSGLTKTVLFIVAGLVGLIICGVAGCVWSRKRCSAKSSSARKKLCRDQGERDNP